MLLGAEDAGPLKLTYVAHNKGSYSELGELLESFGRTNVQTTQVDLECDGIRMQVAIGLNSGTVTGCELVAFRSDLVPMRLVREGDTEREGKTTGLLTEVQTGDAAFDRAVFIETAAAAADVHAALAAPGVRAAIRRLLDEVPAVVITESHVRIEVPLSSTTFALEKIRERLAALRAVAGAPRPLVTTRVALPRAVLVTRGLVWTSLPVSVLTVVIGGQTYPTVTGRPFLTGLVLGLVIAALLAVVIGRTLRGRSTSGKEILRARLATFLSMPILSMGSLVMVNGALDDSPERVIEMNVDSSWVDSDDSSMFHVQTTGPEGGSHTYSFKGTKPSGASRIFVPWRSGALGWTWQSGHSFLRDGEVAN